MAKGPNGEVWVHTPQLVIKKLYEQYGWNSDKVKFVVNDDNSIKVKGGLTGMNWGAMKFSFYDLGWNYDKNRKVFVKRATYDEIFR